MSSLQETAANLQGKVQSLSDEVDRMVYPCLFGGLACSSFYLDVAESD